MEFKKPAEDDGNHLNISWDPEEIIQYADQKDWANLERIFMTRQKGTLMQHRKRTNSTTTKSTLIHGYAASLNSKISIITVILFKPCTFTKE